MHIKQLSGHSGCSVFLMKSASGFYVRKISSSLAYNERLKIQAAKQVTFLKKNKLNNISTPQVYSHGYINNLFFFDMEYIIGENFCYALRHIPMTTINLYIDHLISYMLSLPTLSTEKSEYFFQNKIEALKTSVDSSNPLIQQTFETLDHFDFSAIPSTPCCGDLTLENIIVTRSGKIYLIDFLDSFFDSFYMDIAKLLQDIHLGWAYRNYKKDMNIEIRRLIIRNLLLNKLTSKIDINMESIYHILLLNLLRIVPYTTDPVTKDFLKNSITATLKTIENIQYKGEII